MQDIIFDQNKTQLFFNYSDEAFPSEKYPCTWAGNPIAPIDPGTTVEMPQYLAMHVAKHLANREIFKESDITHKDPITNGDLKENLIARALLGEGKNSRDEKDSLSFPVISKKEKVEEEEPEATVEEPEKELINKTPEAPKSKGGRPKKVEDPVVEEKNPDFEE